MIFKINRLKNLLQDQMKAEEVDWKEVESISKELDLLIIEYYKEDEKKSI